MKITNTIENIIITVITGIFVFFAVTWANERAIDKMNQYNLAIIDSLINKIPEKTVYQITNDFDRIKAKKDGDVNINLNNTMKVDTVKQEQKRRRGWFQRR
jgi:hypothetical protein